METSKFLFCLTFLQLLLSLYPAQSAPTSKLFREYLGADSKDIKFSDVPINPHVEFHFILAFTLDYTPSGSSPTDGKFNIFWANTLSPSQVYATKIAHRNVKVAVSLGGDSVGKGYAYFTPSSVKSWVKNAVASLTKIIKEYDLDGIDIDYEHFKSDPNTFAECIGQLVTILKRNKVISFASIAPYDSDEVQSHYQALWRKYGHVIDYVNFQFYAYDKGTNVSQFLNYFKSQSSNYKGGKILVSFGTDGSGGLSPADGFFTACSKLKSEGKLYGIFVWSADDSKKKAFRYDNQSQALLAS